MKGYAVRNDGVYGWRTVNSASDCLPNETWQEEQPAPYVDVNADIKSQISALEALQTPRRIRDAIAGIDNGWIANLETQIADLRAQLK